jgi:hypothetical protein
MEKNWCKKPNCIYWAIPKCDYCRKHQKELEEKSDLYFKEMNDEN